MSEKPAAPKLTCFHAMVHGRVQGVYFRDFTMRWARALGVTGYAKNLPGGTSVEVMAEGEHTHLEQLLEHINMGPRSARVDRVDVEWLDYTGTFNYFEIRF